MPVEETLTRRSVVLVAAHPDDETAGAGGVLPRMLAPVIVHVTGGAPRNLGDSRAAGYERREDYAAARRRELLNALQLAGISEDRTRALDVTDQEASLDMTGLAKRLAAILREVRPGVVLTHPYEGGHPDHDATAFAVHAACALAPAPPAIWEFTSYHAYVPADPGQNGRPVPPAIETGRFLHNAEPGETITLSSEARERKRRMIECFATQLHMLRHFPDDVERYRRAPAYDFTEAPHPGKLFYESCDWGMTGDTWRRLAAEAVRALKIPSTL